MPRFSWTDSDVAQCDVGATCPATDDNYNRECPVSCMSAFDDDDTAADALVYSTKSCADDLQLERDCLLQERDRLLAERQKSQEQRRIHDMHIESLSTLVQEALVEHRRLEQEIRAVDAQIPSSGDCSSSMSVQKRTPLLRSPVLAMAAGERLSETSSSGTLQSNSRYNMPQPFARTSDRLPEERCVPTLDYSAFKTHSPTSPSVCSLSTRSGSLAPSTCTNLLSQRSSISGVTSFASPVTLPTTFEVDTKPSVLSTSGATQKSSHIDAVPRRCAQSQVPSSCGSAVKIGHSSTNMTSLQHSPQKDAPRILSASRVAPALGTDDMASTRAKLAEIEEQIRLAKGRAASARMAAAGTGHAAVGCTRGNPCLGEASQAYTERKDAWNWPESKGHVVSPAHQVAHRQVDSVPPKSGVRTCKGASRVTSPPRSSNTVYQAVASACQSNYMGAGRTRATAKNDAACKRPFSPHAGGAGPSCAIGQQTSPSEVRRSISAPRIGGQCQQGVLRTSEPVSCELQDMPRMRSRSTPTLSFMQARRSLSPSAKSAESALRSPKESMQRSPRSLSRQRRLQEENWARRGLVGSSPPPKRIVEHGCVRVICRLRPPGVVHGTPDYRCRQRIPRSVFVTQRSSVDVCEPNGSLIRSFVVDSAFGEDSRTDDIFMSLRQLMRKSLEGRSVGIIAYGPSGAGKSHTMYGDARDIGLVPRAVAELVASQQPISISMVELHNDSLTDLLLPPGLAPPPLEIRSGHGGASATIEGAREVIGSSVASLLATIQDGLARRHLASTLVNSASSRSHIFISFRVGNGSLTLVDLAGVERVKRSGAEGNVLREAQNINRSLNSLGDVVDALRRGAAHIPARNTRLAQLVAGTLRSGAETAVIVCVPPEESTRDEAVSALCFAERVRRIPGASGVAHAHVPEVTSAGAFAKDRWASSTRARSR